MPWMCVISAEHAGCACVPCRALLEEALQLERQLYVALLADGLGGESGGGGGDGGAAAQAGAGACMRVEAG